jgi:hypothetical protein
MILKKIILSCLFLLITFQYSFSQGQVSQYLHQILDVEQDEDNPPSSIYIKLHTSRVEVKQMKGTRMMVTGKISLGIPNVFFLDVLIEKGRYELLLSSDGGSGLRLEDKFRQPMILQGEQCREEVSYVVYVPETVTSVAFENASTGETKALSIIKRDAPLATTTTTDDPDDGQQVFIKDK